MLVIVDRKDQWRSVVLMLGGAQNLHISKKSLNLKLLF